MNPERPRQRLRTFGTQLPTVRLNRRNGRLRNPRQPSKLILTLLIELTCNPHRLPPESCCLAFAGKNRPLSAALVFLPVVKIDCDIRRLEPPTANPPRMRCHRPPPSEVALEWRKTNPRRASSLPRPARNLTHSLRNGAASLHAARGRASATAAGSCPKPDKNNGSRHLFARYLRHSNASPPCASVSKPSSRFFPPRPGSFGSFARPSVPTANPARSSATKGT